MCSTVPACKRHFFGLESVSQSEPECRGSTHCRVSLVWAVNHSVVRIDILCLVTTYPANHNRGFTCRRVAISVTTGSNRFSLSYAGLLCSGYHWFHERQTAASYDLPELRTSLRPTCYSATRRDFQCALAPPKRQATTETTRSALRGMIGWNSSICIPTQWQQTT